MKRDIKFRGYDSDLKKWHYGNYYFYTDTIYCIASDKEHEENEHHCILFDGFCDWNMQRPHYKAFVDKESIGQSTGLKDKNDIEIYEGDIVKIQDNATYYYGVVVYSDKYASFVFRNTNSIKFEDENIGDYDELEVIGNIYENPNLLQEENNNG